MEINFGGKFFMADDLYHIIIGLCDSSIFAAQYTLGI
jgi:hypothetical protein